MKEQLATIRSEALAAFAQAGSSAELDALRVKYLGKKGELTNLLKGMNSSRWASSPPRSGPPWAS